MRCEPRFLSEFEFRKGKGKENLVDSTSRYHGLFGRLVYVACLLFFSCLFIARLLDMESTAPIKLHLRVYYDAVHISNHKVSKP